MCTSGSQTAATRPGMRRLLDYTQAGDTVVVWQLMDFRAPCRAGQLPGYI